MTETEAIEAALESRLFDLQMEIDRTARLAAAASDPREQNRLWQAAEECQAEAHRLRQDLAHVSKREPETRRRPIFSKLHFWRLHRASH
jgi:predicted  nucleic acid-binding Zn-ribbon protein